MNSTTGTNFYSCVCVCLLVYLCVVFRSYFLSRLVPFGWMDDGAVYSMTGRRFVSLCSSLSMLCVCEFGTKAGNGPTSIIGEVLACGTWTSLLFCNKQTTSRYAYNVT